MRSGSRALAATDSLWVGPSPIHGTGVFANRAFAADELIECCPVIVCPAPEEVLLEQTALRGLYFHWEGDGVAIALGFGSLYNHAWHASARYELDHEAPCARFIAVRPIGLGEEVTINYTGEPDGDGPLWFDAGQPDRPQI